MYVYVYVYYAHNPVCALGFFCVCVECVHACLHSLATAHVYTYAFVARMFMHGSNTRLGVRTRNCVRVHVHPAARYMLIYTCTYMDIYTSKTYTLPKKQSYKSGKAASMHLND
jgi:hypothetical protein